MKRITKIVALAAIALFATAAVASASVAVTDGVGYVGKGDVQSALGWNNAAFDNGVGSLKFTASAEKIAVDYPMTCFDLNGGGVLSGVTGHRIITYSGYATIDATQIKSSNGKQITGFNLTGKSTGFTFVSGSSRDTGCPEGSVLFMNTGTPTQPNTVSITGGLKVSGLVDGQTKTVDLPNTPVAPIV